MPSEPLKILVMFCYAMLHYVMLCDIVLCYVTLCYIMSVDIRAASFNDELIRQHFK